MVSALRTMQLIQGFRIADQGGYRSLSFVCFPYDENLSSKLLVASNGLRTSRVLALPRLGIATDRSRIFIGGFSHLLISLKDLSKTSLIPSFAPVVVLPWS